MNASAATLVTPTRSRVWVTFALVAMLVASMLSTAIGLQSVSAQDSQESLASAVPADTVIYVSMNLDQDSEQWNLTYELLERAGISDLAESETGASAEEIGGLAESSNFTGEGALVFTDAESLASFSSADMNTDYLSMTEMDASEISEEIPEGFAFIVQPDDPAALSAQFAEMTQDEATTAGTTVQTVEYSGVTITYWESTDTAVTGTATAEVNGTVVLATRASDVEPIIDAAQGNIDNLASSEGFNDVTSRLQTGTIMLGYMNLDLMITAIESDPEFAAIYGDLVAGEDMGSGKGHAGFAVYASESGFHSDAVMILDDPTQLPDASFTPTMASKMPADVMMFGGSNNFYGTGVSEMVGGLMQMAFAEMGNTSGMATPVATPTMDETWTLLESTLGFNPDTDLLAKLDGEYAAYVGVYDLDGFTPRPEFLFVSETSDAATLQQTTATITNIVNLAGEGEVVISSRTVDGGEITVITMDASATGGIPVVLEYGVVNNEMLIGVNGAIDRYLDGSEPTLADDANFQNTFSLLPSENVVSMSYMNIEGQVMPLLDWFTVMLMGSMSTLDNHEECATYATQAEAQDAYDADPGTLWMLDMDFDGEVCEDFFAASSPQASPESITDNINIPSAGMVTWVEDGALYTSSILVIGD